jgi:putative N6-adenine-specific DNA methylase
VIELGKNQPLTATCARGLEKVLADELRSLDADAVAPDRGSVLFSGDLRTVYDTNLRLRTAMRVLVPLVRGEVKSRGSLYELAASVAWEEVIADGQTFAVEVVGRHRSFRNTTFAGQVVKDGLVDRLRAKRGRRPDVDRDQPDIRIHLRLVEKGATTLSLDSSGEPLSHRGYRPRGGPAPLAETLAAGILLLAGYDGSEPLLDPMCGRLAFGEIQHEASHGHRDAPQPIIARDRAERSVRSTQRNLKAAWMDSWVEVEQRDALDLVLPWGSGGVIVANPPYGKRVSDVERLFGLYRRFGDSLKKQATGATAWILAGEPRLAKVIGLKPSRRIPLFNGPIECRLLKFEMYEGTKKHKAG